MISRYTYKKIKWIDLESPTQEEVKALMKEFDIHPVVANEILYPTMRPKVDLYPHFIYLILHFPVFQHHHGNKNQQEVDFIVGKDFIITAHYEMIDPLHEFSKIFEVNSIIEKSHLGTHAGFLFYYIIRELYRSLSNELEYIDTTLANIEERIFEGQEKEMVKAISLVNRDLLDFKQSIRLHNEVLASLESAGTRFFDEKFSHYLKAVSGEYHKIASQLEGNRETLFELRKTNDSLLTTNQNETMKALMLVSFVTFPLTLIASIFGMNATNTPIIGVSNDFWIILGIMIIAVSVMFSYFKYKRWL